MYHLASIQTTQTEKLRTEVEQRTTYALDRCELNIFETHKKVENVRLTFEGFTITSMLRGKKILHASQGNVLNYLPGESFILPSDSEMVIDFPEASYSTPTQCTALVIENDYLQKQLQYINETFPRDKESGDIWQLSTDQLWLQNDESIANLGNRLIRIFSGSDPLKDILVDIKLKELVLAIMRLQNYGLLTGGQEGGKRVNERFKAVIEYIRQNITSVIDTRQLSNMACMSKSVFYRTFTNEFGMPPGKMILGEKMKHAKTLMASGNLKIKEICFALGFSDPNYFSRVFKKVEGVTPGEYLLKVKMVDQV
jgi:AraC-like DNA-binding protein